MAVTGRTIMLHKVSVRFSDGTGTPVTLTLGNDTSVAIDGLTGRVLNAIVKVQRRGKHYHTASGERVYPTVTIEFLHDGWKGVTAVPGTPLEFATFQGLYSANVSTAGGGTRSVKAIDIDIIAEDTDYGGSADHTLSLADCVLETHGLLTDGDPATYSMTFSVTGAISGDLAYAES
jgi:hypothetical protein